MSRYGLAREGDWPHVGLLHGDADVARSRYAAFRAAELPSAPDFWLLGHVHIPRCFPDEAAWRAFYPGSPQPLDPGETGGHGAWLVESVEGRLQRRPVPVATVRYDTIEVDLSSVTDREGWDTAWRSTLQDRAQRYADEGGSALQVLDCRLRFVGRTPVYRDAARWTEELLAESGNEHFRTALRVHLRGAAHEARPAVDLDHHAAGKGLAAAVARVLLELEHGSPGPELQGLLDERLQPALRGVHQAYATVPGRHADEGVDSPPDAGTTRALLRREAWRLLDALLTQRGE